MSAGPVAGERARYLLPPQLTSRYRVIYSPTVQASQTPSSNPGMAAVKKPSIPREILVRNLRHRCDVIPGNERWTRLPSLLFALMLLAAGSSYGSQSTSGAEAASSPEDGSYVLQSGDEIEIKVFEIPELADRVRIRPDGKISVMLLDDVVAAGLTPSELDQVLTTGYTTYYFNPRVTVIVRVFSSERVYVGGEVNQPGMLQLAGGLSALGAVLEAGGFRPTAKRSSVILLRKGDGGPQIQRLNLDDVLEEGAPDIVLQPFDVVYVPRTFIAKANLFVQQYIRDLLPVATNANFTYILGQGVAVIP